MGTKTRKLSNTVDQIVEWQSVIVADGSTNTTAVAGEGYFINTSSGAHTINLPSSPKIGDVVKVSIITAGNDVTIGRNGNNINGAASDLTISVDGDVKELVYSNATEGWKTVGEVLAAAFTEATGGTVTTSGDFKIHTFTGDGCFVVSQVGNSPVVASGGPSDVSYLVVAGGGGTGKNGAGGGGAGGFREGRVSIPHYTASPLANGAGLTITAQTYPITVGGGGAGLPGSGPVGCSGSNSVFSTITSAGGGGGASQAQCGTSGGSGGGGGAANPPSQKAGGAGNTPPVSPPQGRNGGTGSDNRGGGGGGASANGEPGSPSDGATGGNGHSTSISGSSTAYAGGGGGGSDTPSLGGAAGGTGGGGQGGSRPGPPVNTNGTANTGGGGGGAGVIPCTAGGTGGSGIVIIRYKYQ